MSKRFRVKAVPALLVVLLVGGGTGRADDPGQKQAQGAGPLVNALWLVHRYGTASAVDPVNDQKTKGTLAKALGKDSVLTAEEVKTLIDPVVFARLAGLDARLESREVLEIMESDALGSRQRLLPGVEAHARYLTTTLDMIDPAHAEAGARLADSIVENRKAGRTLHVTCVCTGNSRRSILGATMGNIAAAYYGAPEVRFHSGGTAPTAVNSRAIATLKAIGVTIEPTGGEAPRGEPKTANPVYLLRWGKPAGAGDPAFEAAEFSKAYFDPSNPREGFAALMVCGEADEACPFVKGASLRVSMPYLDPKIYDDSVYETIKYAERRDDIGRLMLCVLMRVRNRVDTQSF